MRYLAPKSYIWKNFLNQVKMLFLCDENFLLIQNFLSPLKALCTRPKAVGVKFEVPFDRFSFKKYEITRFRCYTLSKVMRLSTLCPFLKIFIWKYTIGALFVSVSSVYTLSKELEPQTLDLFEKIFTKKYKIKTNLSAHSAPCVHIQSQWVP